VKASHDHDEENAERAMRQFVWCLAGRTDQALEHCAGCAELCSRMISLPRGYRPFWGYSATAAIDLG